VRRTFRFGIALFGAFLKFFETVRQFLLLALQLFDQFPLFVHDGSELIEIVLKVRDLGFEFDDSFGVAHDRS
jgi:hypothetical protein